jgi:hypothetical protein
VIAGTNQTATEGGPYCTRPGANKENQGCSSTFNSAFTPNNYGSGLNSIGAGVHATEWTSNYVETWFFPRNAIPATLSTANPDVSTFGEPAVHAQGLGCAIDNCFNNMTTAINTDFCGTYAGTVYPYDSSCPQSTSATGYDSCTQLVGNNPDYFRRAYWEVNSLKVHQMPVGAVPTSSYSKAVFSPTAIATTNSVPIAMGGTVTTLGSYTYTGSISTKSSSTATTTATTVPTPIICPASNNTGWSDYNGIKYNILCGFNYTAQAATKVFLYSFEACLEYYDTYELFLQLGIKVCGDELIV